MAHLSWPTVGATVGHETEGYFKKTELGDGLGNMTEERLPDERRERFGEIRDYVPNCHNEHQAKALPSDDTIILLDFHHHPRVIVRP